MHILFGFGFAPGPMEMVIILLIAVMLFGKRLPEVGRSLGKGIVEFKKGVKGIEDEVERAQYEQPAQYDQPQIPSSEASESSSGVEKTADS